MFFGIVPLLSIQYNKIAVGYVILCKQYKYKLFISVNIKPLASEYI